jgi:hypothetical protein
MYGNLQINSVPIILSSSEILAPTLSSFILPAKKDKKINIFETLLPVLQIPDLDFCPSWIPDQKTATKN